MNLMEKLVTILLVVVDFLFIFESKFLRFDFLHRKDILLGLIEE